MQKTTSDSVDRALLEADHVTVPRPPQLKTNHTVRLHKNERVCVYLLSFFINKLYIVLQKIIQSSESTKKKPPESVQL